MFLVIKINDSKCTCPTVTESQSGLPDGSKRPYRSERKTTGHDP